MKTTTIQTTASKLLFPDAQRLRQLNIPGLTYFRFFYSPTPSPSMMSLTVLENPSHPLYLATRKRYIVRDRNTLWWNVFTPNNVASKRVVRSWCNRRLKNAFREELGARGFDRDGRSMGQHAIHNLRGSVDMQGCKELITADYRDVKRQIGLSVEAILRIQSRTHEREQSNGPAVRQRDHERELIRAFI